MFKDNKRTLSTDTLIGQGTLAEGKIACDAGIRIEGECRGDITSKAEVIVGECGIVRAAIEAQDVTIAGAVYGDITVRGRLVITATGQLHGTMQAAVLHIQEGALFNGQSRMERPGAAPAKPSPPEEYRTDEPAKEKVKARQAV
ncbi:polymer-forming cytoskeletal protein [Paenibacillus sp. IB182496]|uniref:Polymer-forming cytoskeletal protein n=1 Tax=Paenibacillus sabuli TaxID=2772509 RepID=A0A927BUM6_9BACL|nr:polymer-forming cytoskeletal protein [Paenibacillus sabuli]MBD2847138.1 polymer-forming cytoskeletal protein [Paenibacillus sabuli]